MFPGTLPLSPEAAPSTLCHPNSPFGSETARYPKYTVQQQLCCQAEHCSAGTSLLSQEDELEGLCAAGPVPEGQGAAVTPLLAMLLEVLGHHPKPLFPPKPTSSLFHPLQGCFPTLCTCLSQTLHPCLPPYCKTLSNPPATAAC